MVGARSRAQGTVSAEKMPRLNEAVEDTKGPAKAAIKCFKDEHGRYLVRVIVDMVATMRCQRCLGACEVTLNADTVLACVWDDASAGELPSDYDPLVTGDMTDLYEMVEDELLLAVPAVAMHNTADCRAGVASDAREHGAEIEEDGAVTAKANPFAVLGELLRSPKGTD